jgi:hypothetical protein
MAGLPGNKAVRLFCFKEASGKEEDCYSNFWVRRWPYRLFPGEIHKLARYSHKAKPVARRGRKATDLLVGREGRVAWN